MKKTIVFERSKKSGSAVAMAYQILSDADMLKSKDPVLIDVGIREQLDRLKVAVGKLAHDSKVRALARNSRLVE